MNGVILVANFICLGIGLFLPGLSPEKLNSKFVSHGLGVNMLLKVLSKVNWVLSGTSVTPLVFLKTFLTMFDTRISGEINFELN